MENSKYLIGMLTQLGFSKCPDTRHGATQYTKSIFKVTVAGSMWALFVESKFKDRGISLTRLEQALYKYPDAMAITPANLELVSADWKDFQSFFGQLQLALTALNVPFVVPSWRDGGDSLSIIIGDKPFTDAEARQQFLQEDELENID